MHTRYLTASALLAAALSLSGCGNDGADTAPATAGSASGADGSSHSPDGGGGGHGATGNDADTAFLAGMVPHHEQAVEMSDHVLAADPPAEVAAIARKVKAAQAPEIERMKTMLDDLGQAGGAGASDGTAHGDSHAPGGHGGMMSGADLTALETATGKEAARLYLQGMIAHHRGAIEASEGEIAEGEHRPAVELARSIATSQAAEITQMEALLASL